MTLPDLTFRHREPELMDAPGLDVARHHGALRALSRINVLSLSVGRIWRRLRALTSSSREPVRVLDVACGGGDIPLALKRLARREDVDLFCAFFGVCP